MTRRTGGETTRETRRSTLRLAIAPAALVLAALRAQASSIAAIGLLSLVVAVVGVVTPQVTSTLVTAGLRYDVRQATAVERDLSTTFPGGPTVEAAAPGNATSSADAAVWGGFDRDLRAVRRSMSPALRDGTGPAEYTATSSTMPIPEFDGGLTSSYLALAASPSLTSRVRYVAGAAPAAVADLDDVVPMALSRSTATALRWKVGATHEVTTDDGSDIRVRLTGVFVARDASESFWGHVFGVLDPQLLPSPDGSRTPIGTGVVASASYPALLSLPAAGLTGGPQTDVWFPVRSGDLDPLTVSMLATEAARFTSIRHDVPSAGPAPLPFSTRLPSVIADSQARLATARSVSSSVLVGPIGAAFALELLLARLALARARSVLDLIGARGASRGSLRGLLALIAATGSVVGALIGGAAGQLVAQALTGAPAGSRATVVAVAVSALVPIVITAALLPRLVARPARFPIRPVSEAVVVSVTALSAVLVARRGITEAPPSAGVDPLSAALPLLIAVCGCLVALRLLPVALAVIRRRTRLRRGVALSTGLAVAERAPSGLGAPLLAATVGIAVALFSSVLGSTLADGLQQAARASVGADVGARTAELDFTTELPLTKVPGVDRVAFVSDAAQVQVQIGASTVLVGAVVADPAALRAVQRGVPDAVPLPAALDRAKGDRIPVVVSGALADRLARSGGGGAVQGTALDPVAVSREPLGLLPSTDLWLVVAERHAGGLGLDNDAPDRTLMRTTPGADRAAVAAAVQRLVGSGVTVTTTDQVAARLSENPLVPGLRIVAVEAAALGAAFGLLALLAATLLDTASRRRRIGLLSLLGLSRRQRRDLVVAETLPLGLTALVAGIVVAAAMVALVLPSADLRTFTGAASRPPIHLDLVTLSLLVAAGLAALALVSTVAVRLAGPTRRRDSAPSEGTE